MSGQAYVFRVRARNKWGYGPYSETVSIQASTNPQRQQSAPVTQNFESSVLISWAKPEEKGAPIEEYEVMILTHDGVESSTEPLACNGADQEVVAARSCVIPLVNLRSEPFLLDYPMVVRAKVRSRNANGWSTFSDVNTEGAIIKTEPAQMLAPTRGHLTDQNYIHIVWQPLETD